MGAYVKVSAGHDPEYPWRQMAREVAKTGANYYMSAVVEHGEPEGRWSGEGLASLGIHDGDKIDHDQFISLYSEFRNPQTGEFLGRQPRVNKRLNELFAAKKAAEPAASKARLGELWQEARAEVKTAGVMYLDAPFSVSKDISLAHASALAKSKQAREAGDEKAAAMWAGRADGVWAAIQHGNREFLGYVQREAGYVRMGYHGAKGPDGESTGIRVKGHDIPVASFAQHTSRTSDMQLHIHNDLLNKIMGPDGKWYATDTRAIYKHAGAGAAVGATAMHADLANQFGFEFAYRPASRDWVIKSVPDKAIRAFSSRGVEVDGLTSRLAGEFRRVYGRDAALDELYGLSRVAARETKRGKPEGGLDFGKLLAHWSETSRAAQLGSLTGLAEFIWRNAETGSGPAQAGLSEAQAQAVMAQAVAQVQADRPKWSRTDLVVRLQKALPDGFVLPPGADADAFLTGLADRALAGDGGEQVVCLTAPEYPRVPGALRRADGESVYHPHGSELYATAGQMDMEARVVAMAKAGGAPRLAPDVAAKLIGADEADLEAQLREAAASRGEKTGSGLRLDQGAAAYHALTSPRRTEVILAAAGSGKTFTAGVMATAWREAGMGRVFGIATSSAARDELADHGVPSCYNFARYLGHTEDQREALPKPRVQAGDLFLVDEGTMASLPDFDAFQRHVAAGGGAIRMFAGDNQLGAVENVDAAGIIARSGQYARLQEPVRFLAGWERDASLGLHAGDAGALQAYADHGRLHAAGYEAAAEQTARLYMARYAQGVSVNLNAHTHAEVDDLNKRIQAYHREYKLTRGPAVRLAGEARAQAGELIFATKNDNHAEADGGKTVSNGHIMEIREIAGQRVTVRRLTGHDNQTGQREWSEPYTVTARYLQAHGSLGYAQTTAVAEGDTAWVGLNFGSDSRGRESAYPGMTRGQYENHAIVYPSEPDCVSGEEASGAPEVARYEAMAAERDGDMRGEAETRYDPVVMLTRVVRRSDVNLSATETREKALAAADHMGTLWQIRQDIGRRGAAARFGHAVREHLPAEDAEKVLADTDDLYRALRHAELAGKDSRQVLADAIASRPLAGARSVPAVIADRVRAATEHLPPVHARLQDLGDEDLADFAGRTDSAMAGREARLGAHMARTAPEWAVTALGDAPGDGEARREWEAQAGALAGFREITGLNSPHSVIGPEPPTTYPELRAEWHRVREILGGAEHERARDLTEGQLRAQREAALRDTAWLPPDVSREMGVAHGTADHYRTAAMHHGLRSQAARLAGDGDLEALHREKAEAAQAKADRAGTVARVLEAANETRRQADLLREGGWQRGAEAHRELERRGLLLPGEREFASRETPAFDYAARQAAARPEAGEQHEAEASPEETPGPPRGAGPEAEQLEPSERMQSVVDLRDEREAETEVPETEMPPPAPERMAHIEELSRRVAGTDAERAAELAAAGPGTEPVAEQTPPAGVRAEEPVVLAAEQAPDRDLQAQPAGSQEKGPVREAAEQPEMPQPGLAEPGHELAGAESPADSGPEPGPEPEAADPEPTAQETAPASADVAVTAPDEPRRGLEEDEPQVPDAPDSAPVPPEPQVSEPEKRADVPDDAAPQKRGPEPAEPTDEQVRVMLGLDEDHILADNPGRLAHITDAANASQEKVDLEATTHEPDPEDEDLSPTEAWARDTGRTREAVLHDPEPAMPPAPEVQREADTGDFEAAG